MLAALRITQVVAAIVGFALLIASGISQVQVLLGTTGFIHGQPNWAAIGGGLLVVVSFVALALRRRMTSSTQ